MSSPCSRPTDTLQLSTCIVTSLTPCPMLTVLLPVARPATSNLEMPASCSQDNTSLYALFLRISDLFNHLYQRLHLLHQSGCSWHAGRTGFLGSITGRPHTSIPGVRNRSGSESVQPWLTVRLCSFWDRSSSVDIPDYTPSGPHVSAAPVVTRTASATSCDQHTPGRLQSGSSSRHLV